MGLLKGISEEDCLVRDFGRGFPERVLKGVPLSSPYFPTDKIMGTPFSRYLRLISIA